MDDIRNHSAAASAEEAEWMATDAVALIVRAVALAGLALAIGVAASLLVEAVAPAPTLASAAR